MFQLKGWLCTGPVALFALILQFIGCIFLNAQSIAMFVGTEHVAMLIPNISTNLIVDIAEFFTPIQADINYNKMCVASAIKY